MFLISTLKLFLLHLHYSAWWNKIYSITVGVVNYFFYIIIARINTFGSYIYEKINVCRVVKHLTSLRDFHHD